MKKEDKALYTCESVIDGYEYKKMAKYFPKKMYWAFVIKGLIFNLIISGILAICINNLIIALSVFVFLQIYFMLIYYFRIEHFAEKIFNVRKKKGIIDTSFLSEFYDNYLIKKGNKISITIDYSEISKTIETDTNFYFEYPKKNMILIYQKNNMDNELINFIRNKFKNIDNRLGNDIKFKTQKPVKNLELIEKVLIVLFILTMLSVYGANFVITKVLEINNTDDATKYVWITWLFLPIPIVSIVLGYKYKKQSIKCNKNIIAGFIVGALLFIWGLFYVIPFKDIIPKFDNTLVVVKNSKNDTNKFNKYLVRDERTLYMSSNIREVYYKVDQTNYKLKDYITGMWQTTDDGIKKITDHLNNTETLWDGGTKIYKSSKYNITIITCNTIEGNKDIFIGDYNMKFDNNTMCR